MPRIVTVGAAQLGPIARADTRRQVVARLLALMRQASAHGCDLVDLPRARAHDLLSALALRAAGDRRVLRARDALSGDQAAVRRGARAGHWVLLRLCGLANEEGPVVRFNASILVNRPAVSWRVPQGAPARTRSTSRGSASSTSRSASSRPVTSASPCFARSAGSWACTCNDRRSPRPHDEVAGRGDRVARLQHAGAQSARTRARCTVTFSPMVSSCRRARTRTAPGWSASPRRVARKSIDQIGDSIIAAPSGEIVAACTTLSESLAIARCDLDLREDQVRAPSSTSQGIAEPHAYGLIVERKGTIPRNEGRGIQIHPPSRFQHPRKAAVHEKRLVHWRAPPRSCSPRAPRAPRSPSETSCCAPPATSSPCAA